MKSDAKKTIDTKETLMLTSDNNTLTREEIISQGHKMLKAQEIKDMFNDTTVTARYFYGKKWYVAKTNSFKNGIIQGQNHVGSYNEGKWSVNEKDNSLSLTWDGYWEDWTAVGYKVNDEFMFFNTDTGTWRITMTLVEQGKLPTEIK